VCYEAVAQSFSAAYGAMQLHVDGAVKAIQAISARLVKLHGIYGKSSAITFLNYDFSSQRYWCKY